MQQSRTRLMKMILSFFLVIYNLLPGQTNSKIDSLLKVRNQQSSDTVKARTGNKLCKLYILNGEPELALKIVEENVILLKIALNNPEKISGSDLKNYKNNLGDCYTAGAMAYSDMANYSKSREYFLKAIKEFTNTDNKAGIARVYNNLGNTEFDSGRYSEAIKCHFASLKISEELGNKKGVASSLNNMANIYGSRGENEKAKAKYMEALAIYVKEGHKMGMGNTYSNIALVYDQLGKFDSATYYIQKAYEVRLEINDKRGIAYCLANWGIFLLEQKKYNEALVYFQKALKAKEEIEDLRGVGSEYRNISSVYLSMNKPKEAIEYAEKGLAISRQVNAIEGLKEAYTVAYKAYGQMGDYKKAFEYQTLFVAINDSMQHDKNSRIITEMNTKYETEKKEKENQLLQTQNQLSTETIKQQKIITYLVIGGLMVTLFLAYFIFKGLKRQRVANTIISKQKHEVEKQKELVEEKQKEIIDSINYAKRIQNSLLANKEFVDKNTKENFIFFKPKDIVSGDFYWATHATNSKNEELFYLACCDSTGHGVPGAFMSLLNIGFLSEAIKEKDISEPDAIFNYVRQRLIDSISKEEQKDGFDGILICMNKTTGQITYAAANNSPLLISENALSVLRCDKMPVGKGEKTTPFTLFHLEFKPGSVLYLLTDGYPDQFGGPKGKKFKYKPLEELLLANFHLSLNDQANLLESVFSDWRGSLEQVDDVLMMGVKL